MQMYDYFTNVLNIKDEKILERLMQVAEIRRVPRRTIVVREGEVQQAINFVISGCLCGLTQNNDGEEVVTCFCCHPGETTMSAFSLQEPAVISTVALTDSEILSIPLAEVLQLVENSMDCMRLYNRLLEQALRRMVTMQMVIYRGNAMQRYQWFCKEYPGLIDTISNKYIASFLQMTNVTLSRLRRAERRQEVKTEA